MGNFPGNPIDESKQQEIKRIIERVTVNFSKFYAISFKEVLVEEIKKKRERLATEKVVENKKKQKSGEPKPRRERKKREKKKMISAKVIYTMELDSDVDPYVVYAIKASMGKEEVVVYKRYKQFKALKKKAGSKIKAEFPKASSKFGGRNLEADFIRERVEVLSKYLQACIDDETVSQSPEFIKFLGLGKKPEDFVWQETFERAYYRTRRFLWQWKRVVYDSEEEGIAKLIIEEVKDAMWSDISSKLPASYTVRKKTLQAVYKSLSASVGPPCQAAYAACKKAAETLKPTVVKTLGEAVGKMIEIEETVKEKIIGVLSAAFKPFTDAISGLVAPMIGQIVPKICDPVFAILTGDKRAGYMKAIEDGFLKEDESKMDEIQKEVSGVRKEIQNKINEEIQKALEPIIGDFKGKITLDALGTIFGPLARFDKLLYWLFEFIDPGNQFYVVKSLLQWKKKIKETPPEKVEELLDDEEHDIDYWKIWRSNVDIKYAGWRTAYELYYVLPDTSCYPIIYVFYDFVYDVAKLNKKCFKKKFSYKWGDYLSHKAKNDPSAKENWAKTVDECFALGYNRALKCFWKEFPPMFVDYIKRVLRVLIVDKVQNKILETTKEALDPLAQLIVPPIDNLLDFMAMVEEVITTTLDNVLSDIVAGIHPFMKQIIDEKRCFIDEVKKAAHDVSSAALQSPPPASTPPPGEMKKEETAPAPTAVTT